MIGWIKLHRTLKDWEWYDDINATRLLVHLLISVNYQLKQRLQTYFGVNTHVRSCLVGHLTLILITQIVQSNSCKH